MAKSVSAHAPYKSDVIKGRATHKARLRDYASSDSATERQNSDDCPPAWAMITLRSDPTTSDITDLVEHHLHQVGVLVSERLRNVPTHVRRDDLMSAGMMALVLSAVAYDPQRGVPFRSFAAFRIRGALTDELRAMDWASRSVRIRAREVETTRAQLAATLDRSPRTDDIADALGITTRELDVVNADLARGTVLSLQGLAAETLPSATANSTDCPESMILHREQLGYLHDAIAALPERLRFVVVAHYFGHRQMRDIADELSVTQSRVSQMCTEATTLIRDGMNSQLDPEALRPQAKTGRAAATRNAYYQALADRNTVRGRLDMSTPNGEMRRDLYAEHLETPQHIRIA
jgi:RNA polymerase sigma factor for flagellar operon FliA